MDTIKYFDILLVEDNPLDAELIARTFRKNNLVNDLLIIDDGAAALDFIFGRGVYADRKNFVTPKVILLDIKLPKVDGLDVLKEIKGNPETHTIPVIMITSSQEDPDIKMAYRLGANSYVVKPVGYDKFEEAVRNIGLYWLLINQPPAK